MIRWTEADLDVFCRHRPDGRLKEALLAAATREGDRLCWDAATFAEVRLQCSPPGFGDTVAGIAQRIARTLDGAFHTDLQNCPGCKGRQAWLNETFPTH